MLPDGKKKTKTNTKTITTKTKSPQADTAPRPSTASASNHGTGPDFLQDMFKSKLSLTPAESRRHLMGQVNHHSMNFCLLPFG
jgi:hypothetical protein